MCNINEYVLRNELGVVWLPLIDTACDAQGVIALGAVGCTVRLEDVQVEIRPTRKSLLAIILG